MCLPRSRTAAFSLCLSLSLLLAVPSLRLAHAGDADVLKSAERMNKKAMEDYDNLEFDSAKQTLQGAIAKLRESGQDETKVAASIYVNLGIIYFTADKDKTRAVNQFVNALKIDGSTQLDPERATPELSELFSEAQRRVPSSEKGKTPPPPTPDMIPPEDVPPPSETTGKGIIHDSVDQARAGDNVVIRAVLGPDVKANKLFVFYRSSKEEYESLPMVKGKRNDYTATIPGEDVGGKTMQYYIEARDARNRPAVSAGSAASPFIITIVGGTPGLNPDLDGEAPPGLKRRNGEEDPLEDARQRVKQKADHDKSDRGYGRLFFHIMVGTGFGLQLAGNAYEVAYVYKNNLYGSYGGYTPLTVANSGFASSPLHGALEIGVNITKHIGLSVIGRLEGTLINNADSSDDASMKAFGGGTTKAATAAAGMVRFRYTFGEGRFRPGLHLGVGAGQIRHVLEITGANSDTNPLVDFATADYYGQKGKDPFTGLKTGQPPTVNYVCLNKNPCYDNVALGIVLASVGGSFYYDLTKFHNGGFGILLDVAAIFTFADPNNPFGLNFDIQMGVGGHFL